MSPEDFRNLLTTSPFEPFRIHLRNGEPHEVRQREMVMVGLRELILGIPRSRNDGILKSIVYIAFAGVDRVEMIAPEKGGAFRPDSPAA